MYNDVIELHVWPEAGPAECEIPQLDLIPQQLRGFHLRCAQQIRMECIAMKQYVHADGQQYNDRGQSGGRPGQDSPPGTTSRHV